jgi:hypothetical protein
MRWLAHRPGPKEKYLLASVVGPARIVVHRDVLGAAAGGVDGKVGVIVKQPQLKGVHVAVVGGLFELVGLVAVVLPQRGDGDPAFQGVPALTAAGFGNQQATRQVITHQAPLFRRAHSPDIVDLDIQPVAVAL